MLCEQKSKQNLLRRMFLTKGKETQWRTFVFTASIQILIFVILSKVLVMYSSSEPSFNCLLPFCMTNYYIAASQLYLCYFSLRNLAKTWGIHSTGRSRFTFQVHHATKKANYHLIVSRLQAYVKKKYFFFFFTDCLNLIIFLELQIFYSVQCNNHFTDINCSFVLGILFFSWNQIYCFFFYFSDFYICNINDDFLNPQICNYIVRHSVQEFQSVRLVR